MAGKKAKETILVFSAHSDDFVIGAGGTIAEYAKQGKKIIAVIFSYGEKSHPWLQGTVVQKIRRQETIEACKILHCSELFFDLKEGKEIARICYIIAACVGFKLFKLRAFDLEFFVRLHARTSRTRFG